MEGYVFEWINFIKGWRPRYLISEKNYLYISHQKNDLKKKQIVMAETTKIIDDKKKKFSVDLGKNRIYFKAQSADEKLLWIEKIKQNILNELKKMQEQIININNPISDSVENFQNKSSNPETNKVKNVNSHVITIPQSNININTNNYPATAHNNNNAKISIHISPESVEDNKDIKEKKNVNYNNNNNNNNENKIILLPQNLYKESANAYTNIASSRLQNSVEVSNTNNTNNIHSERDNMPKCFSKCYKYYQETIDEEFKNSTMNNLDKVIYSFKNLQNLFFEYNNNLENFNQYMSSPNHIKDKELKEIFDSFLFLKAEIKVNLIFIFELIKNI